MKNIFFICMCAFFACIGCTDDDNELITDGGDLEINGPSLPNDVINEKLFEVINLDYPGLEKAKSHYETGNYYWAAKEILEYYRTRTNVTNPNFSLMNVTVTENEKSIADYALTDFCFYVKNFYQNNDTQQPWSLKKDGKIDWTFSPEGASDEYQKQLHRHQWFIPQAKAYRTSNDEKYATNWISVYSDWMTQNPQPTSGPNTTSWWQLQVATRINDQVKLLEYFKNSVNFSPEWLSAFLVKIAEQADFLVQYPYEQAGNILISQGAALATAGTLLPELKNAQTWQNTGFNILSQQVQEQFLEDGMHYELDLSYHISAIADYYEIIKLAEANNITDKLPATLKETLEKAAEVVINFTYPSYFSGIGKYFVPGFNDTRQASWSRSVLNKNFNRYIEMFPNNANIKYMATYGKGTRPDVTPKLFSTSGYYVLRNGWDKASTMFILSNNYAETAPDIWSHNQADNGTFELYHNGRNFFPDSGVYAYTNTTGGSNDNRKWFRQSEVHNTLTLGANHTDLKDGASYTTTQGRLIKCSTEGTTEVLVTENDGYKNLTHRRYVFFVEKKFFVIVDEGIGEGTTTTPVNINFNLCEGNDSEVIIDEDLHGAHTNFADGNNIIIRTMKTNDDGKVTLTPFAGRVSYDTNDNATFERKAYSVNMAAKSGRKAARFLTVIYPVQGSTDATEISGSFIAGGYNDNGVSCSVTVAGKTYELNYQIQ